MRPVLIEDLRKNISGDIEKESNSYQFDESIFTIKPTIVVSPKTNQDVQNTIEIATKHSVPITARGGGTGIAGQSIGQGIILDLSKHLNQILDISPTNVVVQPGITLQTLNAELAKKQMMFAPDPGSKKHCTVGGMIATNAAGPRALVHGSTRDHVQSLHVALFDSKKYSTSELPKKFQPLLDEIQKNESKIKTSKRNVEKNSSGYHLESLLGDSPSFERFWVGSEGTLGVTLEANLRLIPISEKTCFAVMGFSSLEEAVQEVLPLRETKPTCLELLNDDILHLLKKINPSFIREIGLDQAHAALWVEWNSEIPAKYKKQAAFVTSQPEHIQKIWAERSQVSKNLHKEAEKENRKPLRCIEDACVPIKNLSSYVNELTKLLKKHDAKGAIFGHVGNGHLHVNPNIRTDVPQLKKRIENLMDEFYDLVLEKGGTISGEHGDGLLRIKYAKKQWKDIWPLFESIKKTFDPKGIFNPDKKVPMSDSSWPQIKFEH